jgi:hypothetical protein
MTTVFSDKRAGTAWIGVVVVLLGAVAPGCGNSGGSSDASPGGSATPNAETCSSPQVSCGGTCVDAQTSPANCGTCGHACGSGQACTGGTCTAAPLSCSLPQVACGGACVNTQADPANCGACGHACATGGTCSAGACSAPACMGTLSFGGVPWPQVPALPSKVVAGDFNGDGRPDMAVSSGAPGATTGTVSVFFGRGDRTFESRKDYSTGRIPVDLLTVDLNGDGHPDLLTTNYESGTVSVLINDGSGAFQAAVDYPVGGLPPSMMAGDINEDGRPDIVVASYTDSTLSVRLGTGDGTLQPRVTYPLVGNPVLVALGDFDGDGHLDLATHVAGNIVVLPGNGNGTFRPQVLTAYGSQPGAWAVGDFNGDGKADLAAVGGGSTPSDVILFVGRGDGSFQLGHVGTSGTWGSIVTADVNRDGRLDLVTGGGYTNPTASVHLGNGDGTFRTPVPFDVGDTPVSIAVADLDADGKPDVMVGNRGSQDVSVLPGKGDGTFPMLPTLDIGSTAAGVGAANGLFAGDLQGDGRPDLLVLAPPGIVAFAGSGGGTFQAGAVYTTSGASSGMVMADLNGDGHPDLVVANGSAIEVHLNSGTGTFQPRVEYPAPSGSNAVSVGDFDGDGKTDVVAVASAVTYDGPIAVFRGNGDGTFRTPVTTAMGQHGYVDYLVTGDLNGDGKPDLVLGYLFGGSFQVIALGKGDGTFDVQTLPGSDGRQALLVDLDRDGRLDLLLGMEGGLEVALGKGDGTFGAPSRYGRDPCERITVADLDGDGTLDVATTGGYLPGEQGVVKVFLGRGDGSFASPVDFGGGPTPREIVATDVNGDGRVDLAVTTIDNRVRVLYGACAP